MNRKESHLYRFESFQLDVAGRRLLHGADNIPLTPKAFDMLALLVANSGQLVEKDEIFRAVWADSFVEETNITRLIHTLRKVLGDDGNGNKFIETVPTKGYRFVAEVSQVSEPPALAGGLIDATFTPPADAGGSDLLHDETPVQTTALPRQKTRILLFTVGFATAIALIFLLSFNFQPASSSSSNDAKSIAGQHTTNEEAYRLYLLGRALADKRHREDVRKAVGYFKQAILLDPNYALAYAGLANAQTAMALNGSADVHEQYPKAKAAIETALAIDENVAEAHSYLGEIKLNYDWDFAGAEREHKRAIELNPNSSDAHRMYAQMLGFRGRADESISEIKTAIDLEPGSVENHRIYGMMLFLARRYDEAITELERTVEMNPEFFFAHLWLSYSYRFKGDNDQAFQSLMKTHAISGVEPDEINAWRTTYANSGWRGISVRELENAKANEKKGKPNYMQLAFHSIELGQHDQAFEYTEKAIHERPWQMVTLNVNPRFDPIRSDPRFNDLVGRVGLKLNL